MSTRIRLDVPAQALASPLTEHLLRAGIGAVLLQHLGEPADFDLGADRLEVTAQVGPKATDQLVRDLGAWLDGVLGPLPEGSQRRARIEVEIPVCPQDPQGNPLFGGARRVTPVTSWG